MTPMDNYEGPDHWPPDDVGGGEGEGNVPPDDSMEDIRSQVEGFDQDLEQAGKLPRSSSDTGEDNPDFWQQKAKEEAEAEARIEEEAKQQILEFFKTIKVRGTEQLTREQVEVIWKRLGENPLIIKDFVFILTTRNTANNYLLYPLLPTMPEIYEYAVKMRSGKTPQEGDASQIRPALVEAVVQNYENLGFDPEEIKNRAMGSKGWDRAEKIILLGWVLGLSLSWNAKEEIENQLEFMGLSKREVNIEAIAHALIVVISKAIGDIKAREGRYVDAMSMDRRGHATHSAILESLEGIQNLMDKTFLDSKK